MIYGTAFDAITQTRHRMGRARGLSGLGTLITDSSTGKQVDANLVMGIDQNGTTYLIADGVVFTDTTGVTRWLSTSPASPAKQVIQNEMLPTLRQYFSDSRIFSSNQSTLLQQIPLAALVGVIRQDYPALPFSAYVPPPPPVIPTPVAPAPDQTVAPVPPPTPPPAPVYTVPPGYSVLARNLGLPRAWPVYASNPQFNTDGTTSFSGSVGFYSFDAPSSPPGFSSMGLDTQKLDIGLYAYKETDLGAIQSAAGRTYELFMLEIVDISTTPPYSVVTVYETTEGGGPGLLISDPLALVARIFADVYTFGEYEAMRAGAQKAGVPQKTIDLATEAFLAASLVVATVGVATAVSAPAAGAEVTGESALTGATDVTLVAPTTEGAVAVSGEAATGGVATDAVATTVAGTGASAAGTGGVVATLGGVATKTVVGAVTLLGTTAITTEVKKLTGQLPAQPSYNLIPSTPAAAAPTPAPASGRVSPMLLAAGAALFFFTKKS